MDKLRTTSQKVTEPKKCEKKKAWIWECTNVKNMVQWGLNTIMLLQNDIIIQYSSTVSANNDKPIFQNFQWKDGH
jgi:hypothetical protein